MIRVRIQKGVTPERLLRDGYEKVEIKGTGEGNEKYYMSKHIGSLEIQAKLDFPMNLRVQNWDDNRVPWILFKFLLALEEGTDVDGRVKIIDTGKERILSTSDTLGLIQELSKYTDIAGRLGRWYTEYCEGKLRL
jgi:hypothetical protein